ncbi:hypothetical protein CLV98_101541 [Dyadobacter jejuensis]|uniref:Uncharacterized protein n=1 Tax=Dyadobacter jejuensis TaxID=1082580 RepID=A0A316ASR8_9BACT|nr:hypothetical protein CLV98_101541 [Dyadobacter jejuensis]
MILKEHFQFRYDPPVRSKKIVLRISLTTDRQKQFKSAVIESME